MTTQQLDDQGLSADIQDRLKQIAEESAAQTNMLALFLPMQSDPLIMAVEERITLGRLDKAQDIEPTIDLTPYHGAALGVSRFHAEICRIKGVFHIKDMGSTNGTRINNEKIAPYRNIAFKSGDEIRLGHLVMIVG